MRIFFAGGTGMIGTRLIRHLREQEHDVVVLARRPAEAKCAWGRMHRRRG